MTNVRELSLYELIHRDVTESQRHMYRDELRKRIMNPGLASYLKAWDGSENTYYAGPQATRPTSSEARVNVGMGALAGEMLTSEYQFDDLKMEQSNARGLVQSIADSDCSEALMSPAQLNAWNAIKAKYRLFKMRASHHAQR